jgi:hypothetical protein
MNFGTVFLRFSILVRFTTNLTKQTTYIQNVILLSKVFSVATVFRYILRFKDIVFNFNFTIGYILQGTF